MSDALTKGHWTQVLKTDFGVSVKAVTHQTLSPGRAWTSEVAPEAPQGEEGAVGPAETTFRLLLCYFCFTCRPCPPTKARRVLFVAMPDQPNHLSSPAPRFPVAQELAVC